MKLINTISIALIVLIPCQAALAHSDIQPRVAGGKIVTDALTDGVTDPNVRVFGYDFGENVDDPFFVQDPGFNATSGSGLTAGASLSFALLGGLNFWNGSGGVSFAPVATGETLDLNFGAQTRTVAGNSAPQAGFALQTIGSGGTLHRHLNAFLKGPDGNAVPAGPGSWGAGDGVQAANGIYLFSLQLLQDPAGGLLGSDPVYIVFNNGLPEEIHDQAMEWVETNLVPEPASAAIMAALAWLIPLRRRVR